MGIATQLETAIDNLLNTYINTTSAQVSTMMAPIAVSGATIYLMWLSFSIARGETQDPVSTSIKNWIRISMVASIALGGGAYQSFAVQGLQSIQGAFINAFSGATSVGGLVDNLAEPYNALYQQLWSEATTGVMPNLALAGAAVIVALAQAFLLIVGLGMYLLSKVAFACSLAVGPAFLLGAAFPSTQRFAENWLGQALGFVLTNVLIGACITMLTSFASQFAAHIQANVGNTAIMTDVLSLLIVSATLALVLLNINTVATALTGGVSVGGVGREITRYLMDKLRNGGSEKGNKDESSATGGSISSGGEASPAQKPLYQSRVIDNIKRSA